MEFAVLFVEMGLRQDSKICILTFNREIFKNRRVNDTFVSLMHIPGVDFFPLLQYYVYSRIIYIYIYSRY